MKSSLNWPLCAKFLTIWNMNLEQSLNDKLTCSISCFAWKSRTTPTPYVLITKCSLKTNQKIWFKVTRRRLSERAKKHFSRIWSRYVLCNQTSSSKKSILAKSFFKVSHWVYITATMKYSSSVLMKQCIWCLKNCSLRKLWLSCFVTRLNSTEFSSFQITERQ